MVKVARKGKVGKKCAWVYFRRQWFWEEGEKNEKILRYRERAAALGRFIMQEGQNHEIWIRRLYGLTTRVVDAVGSILSRRGGCCATSDRCFVRAAYETAANERVLWGQVQSGRTW